MSYDPTGEFEKVWASIKEGPKGYPTLILTGDALRSQMQALIEIATSATTWEFKWDLIRALFVARVQPSLAALGYEMGWPDTPGADRTPEQWVKLFANHLVSVIDNLSRIELAAASRRDIEEAESFRYPEKAKT